MAQSQQSTELIPPEIMQLATKHQLGAIRKLYQSPKGHPRTVAAIMLGLFGGGMLFCGFSSPNPTGTTILVILGLICIGLCIYAFASYSNTHGNRKVFLFTDGFIYCEAEQTTVFPWSRVAEILINKAVRNGNPSSGYTITRDDGIKAKFGTLSLGHPAEDDLGQEITDGALPYHLKRAQEDLDAGKDVAFGKITLNVQGIKVMSHWRPWNEVEKIFLEDGMLFVLKHGELKLLGLSVAVMVIPNVHTLLLLADYARKK